MDRRDLLKGATAFAMLPMFFGNELQAQDDYAGVIYELRIYHLNPGKQDLILDRFRTKETKIFERLGMHGVGYWIPTEEAIPHSTLIYILRHENREAARLAWAKFREDPEWMALKAETEKDGAYVAKSESIFMKLTDFSPKV